ncbi:endonuclease/exonuclease/phosphatase family protein [Roseovarius sp.]|uniref:endonuclease/exonuclease/phosphatase family protein n=1 Tax=Roseovarius sp. TaxID=1486281 RepID=UPI0026302C48|nr:endonuclease/exonuclease/phosphatase family protein [Roseovarius sp.]
MRVATFNLQNMRLRTQEGRPVLDGAFDQDESDVQRPVALSLADREQTAKVIHAAQADIVAVQEVFDTPALDFFHDNFLLQTGSPAYPFRYCLAGNDGRGLNVAALCRRQPIIVKSHAGLTGADLDLSDLPGELRDHRLFRRDCLELGFTGVTLFVCHFKAPYPDAEKAYVIREAEARAVRKIVEMRFDDPRQERWMIVGDLNEPGAGDGPARSALTPLKQGFSFDLLDRLAPGTDWTYEVPDTHLHSRPDRILVSPRLAQEYPDVRPEIIRTGMPPPRHNRRGGASGGPPDSPSHASDHALVYADFPGLA